MGSTDQVSDGRVLGRTFLILCLVSFLTAFSTSPFAALFPVYVDADLGRIPLFTGGLRSLMLVLGGAFAVVGGRLCDLLGLKPALLIGLAGTVLTGLVFCVSDPWILIPLIFCMGVASGPYTTAGQSYLISTVRAERLGVGGAVWFLSMTSGNAVGGLVTGLLKERWSFGEIGVAMTAAMVGVLVLALMVLPGEEAPNPTARPRLALWSAYRPLLGQRAVHLFVGMRGGITIFWGMANLVVLPLLIYRVSGSTPMPAYFAAVSLASAAGCQLLVGFLRDRYDRFWPLLTAAAGVVASGICLGLWWHSLAGLFVFGTALTCTAWAVSSLVPGLINEMAAPEEKNRLVGLGHTIWSGAMVCGSMLGGLLVTIHPSVPFFAGAALASGGCACAWRLCAHLDRQE